MKRASSAKAKTSARSQSISASASDATAVARSRTRQQPDEARIASRGRRYPFEQFLGRLPNPDQTLRRFAGHRRIGLYTLMLQEFAFLAGYCSAWVDHVLVTERVVKPAKSDDPDLQKKADDAAVRAAMAWARVQNRIIVLRKLLMGRFYGFSRAEKVWRFDPVVKEWIEDLFDVPWEAWLFGDSAQAARAAAQATDSVYGQTWLSASEPATAKGPTQDYLITVIAPLGVPVDPSKFVHFQWGSADTRYGQGDLSEVYIALWHIQKIQELGLQAVEDWSRLIAIVHIPSGFSTTQRAEAVAAVAEQYRFYVTVPTDLSDVKVETPNGNVTQNAGAGRQEFEVILFYERWIQIRMLGAPQTQGKAIGTGKVEGVRQDIWEDKTPLGSSALDQCLTVQWLDSYCDMNLADLPVELRPRFESDPTEVIDGRQAVVVLDVGVKLAARQITAKYAAEVLCAIGIPRMRANAMVESIIQERDELLAVSPPGTPVPPVPADPQQEEELPTEAP
jgi:hypothetical protein